MRVRLLQSMLVVTTLSLAGSASAHFELKLPTPSKASDTSGGKGDKPCGPDDASAVITPVMGGSMLEIKIEETVYHPGHYRVALVRSRDELDDGMDPLLPTELKEPDVMNAQGMVITSGNSVSAKIQNPPVFPVLADGILAHTAKFNGQQSAMVAIPNMNCDKCTLQVIEFMAQHAPDYFYRHCADLKITADPAKPVFDPSGMGGSGGGGGAGGGGGTGGAGGAGGTAGSASGGTSAGTASGGTTSLAGSTSAGAPGSAGTTTVAGSGAGGSAGVTPPASPEDDGGCSVARAGGQRAGIAALAGSLLLGLGWFARRRNRPE